MYAQVYRFGDCIALYIRNGKTIYITPNDAKSLARVLNACAKDIKANKFSNSKFNTTCIDGTYTGHNGCDFQIKRKENV